MHLVLVNRLESLSRSSNSAVKLTDRPIGWLLGWLVIVLGFTASKTVFDRPDITLAIYSGSRATKQQQQQRARFTEPGPSRGTFKCSRL